ncbi:nitroreductase [Nonomuraea sp. 10N515B]|uniref:nitroreductase n=1 Tax=Nonomuraea sp. 10N515B TaxID=3457422 RepID=UPI003FCECB19
MEAELLEELLRRRHSCRAFHPEQLPRSLVDRMFSIAQRTASWCNTQPWQVIVTSGLATERLRAVLYEAASTRPMRSDIPPPSEYRGIYRLRRSESGHGLYEALAIARTDTEARGRQALENFRFFGAPHVAIVTSDAALGTYGVLDVGGYITTLTLAAEALGIGLVPQAALAMQSPAIRAFFDIPEERVIVAGLSFGYGDHGQPVNAYRTSRADVCDAVTWVVD